MARRRRSWISSLIGLVVILGFLNGVWLTLGVKPGEEVWKALTKLVGFFLPQTGLLSVLWLVPSVILVWQLWRSWALGGILGLIAIALGFVAGLLILAPLVAIVVLAVAIVLALAAMRA